MQAALLLIDLQQDYLDSATLEPHPAAICSQATYLLERFRNASRPVVHVWTTICRTSERMPHWRERNVQCCVEGSAGHRTPLTLQPVSNELVVHKQFFSSFTCPELLPHLRALEIDTLVLAGVFLRACIRMTAIDAYQNGFSVIVAEDAVGDDDPVHAAITRQYLEQRSTRFLPSEQILDQPPSRAIKTMESGQLPEIPSAIIAGSDSPSAGGEARAFFSPRDGMSIVFRYASSSAVLVSRAVQCCRDAQRDWQRIPIEDRRKLLSQLVCAVDDQHESLTHQITREVGKPITDSRAELTFAKNLVLAAITESTRNERTHCGDGWRAIRRPLGVVAVITPWNNPLAIALGKIAPALLYGNTVVWKPAVPGAGVALSVMKILQASGMPPGVVNLVNGSRRTAELLISQRDVAAVTLTGSTAAGTSAQVIAASRRIPFQAEMGGNNAAIVWADTDIDRAAEFVVAGAFRSAGQRCTATRRVIVDHRCSGRFFDAVQIAGASLCWGDPLDDQTDVGPVVSAESFARLAAVVERAAHAGAKISRLIDQPQIPSNCEQGYYFSPTLAVVQEPDAEIWQSETFGPILAVQCAASWEDALRLCNGVRQGLVASLFTESRDRQSDFLRRAEAGILRVNTTTSGASSEAPFCGWKCSGVGPAEHGVGDVEFYTRWQTLYGAWGDCDSS